MPRPSRRPLFLTLALAASVLAPVHAQDFLYTVRPGDNPWNLTERYLEHFGFWPQLQRYNRIADPRRIPPGRTLRIPLSWLKLQSSQVRIHSLQGQVQLADATASKWQAAHAGMELAPGQRLRTLGDGSAMLSLSGGDQVLVRPDSELRLEQAQTPRIQPEGLWLRIELVRGGLENMVQRRSDSGTRFEIYTPAAVVAVRGTEFRVWADASGLRTEVLQGAVALSNTQGSVSLGAGTGSLAAAGQAPRAAAALLPAPDLASLPARIKRLPISLPLPPLPGAAGYQTQLLPAGATTIASDERSSTPAARARGVPDGEYVIRVRGIDAQGLEGQQAERAITLDARPEPPVLAEPRPDAQLATATPTFRWGSAGPQASYRFQLGRDAALNEPLLERQLTQPSLRLDTELPPGLYHWRVALHTPEEGQGPFSDVQRLRLLPTPPLLEAPAQDDDTLTLRWRAAQPGASYRVQITRVPGPDGGGAAEPLLDRRVDQPLLALPLPVPGSYQVRVQTITADGFEGSWSEPQGLTVEAKRDFGPALWLLLPLLLAL